MSVMIVMIPIIILAVLLCIALPIFLGVFVYSDAKLRHMEPLLWALIAVLAPSFIGLIIYLVVRRDHIVLSCPSCGSDVQESFVSCPNCGQKLTASCGKCGTPLRPEWKLCPQCGTEITEIGTFTPPVMNKGSNNKKLIGVVIAILLIPIVLIVIAFCGFVSYGTITGHDVIKEEVFNDQLVVNEFKQHAYYSECDQMTVSEADLGKEAEDWVAKCKSGKKGIYAKTFCKPENGEFSSYLGSGTYNMIYSYMVVVINDENSYIPKFSELMHYGKAEFLISEEMSQTFCEINAYCDNLMGVTEDEKELAEEYVRSSRKAAKEYGNVFVIKYPQSYNICFDFTLGYSRNISEKIQSKSLDIVIKNKTDMTYNTDGMTYTIPLEREYYSPIKRRTITETMTEVQD